MNGEKHTRVCPAELAGSLDNSFRKLFQNPRKILEPYIGKGMTVLDLGCGPGFFSLNIAEMVGDSGRVIAADLQEGMLEKVNRKIRGKDIEQRIQLHKCQEDRIGVTENVDFVLAFWMVHEVPEQVQLFRELKSILKPVGKIYIAEPKFHVSEKSFKNMIDMVEKNGFEIAERPRVFFSRTVLFTLKKP
ncbi:MAG: class I SAM-dependent methyltransferase [Bacteroidetes bacterium]|nr:MAG: class I SAM-dependent methyltransferase [Bacteroidota bacterium]